MQNDFPETNTGTISSELIVSLHQAQQGNSIAFDRLVRHYRPYLFSSAFLRTASFHAAEDVVQEVLAIVWKHLFSLKDPQAFPAWLRTILVRTCNNWYHAEQRSRDTTHSWDDLGNQITDGTTSLGLVLRRDEQRALQEALLNLPEANRLALLLHAWSGYSYAEIADLVAVAPSTIEGRIYRARRQLRDQLPDLFPQARQHTGSQNTLRNEKKIMTTISTTNSPLDQTDLTLQSVLFSERLSRLIDAGVSLTQSLQSLEEMPPPFGPAIQDLRERILAGDVLSGPMQRYPGLFSPFYIGMVRAGEMGGNLDETLQRARRVSTSEWELARRRPANESILYLTLPSPTPVPGDWYQLSDFQRLATQILFCEGLSMLLASGVTLPTAITNVGELLPLAQRAKLVTVQQAIDSGASLPDALGLLEIFPAFILSFFSAGYVSGTLNTALYLAAETIARELKCRFAMPV